jgi:hypothetical protein
MNSNEDQLNRLFKAAARAPRTEAGEARFALEARVLADWRGTRGENGDVLLLWLRRAAIFAGVLAVASLAWNYQTFTRSGGDELAVADAAMRTGVEP